MNELKIAENIANLRKKNKVTQDELANFLGVTKAAVSKWENGMSYPDMLLLPQIASFFQVTVDDLIGYLPQLSDEQIQRSYEELSHIFEDDGFEKGLMESRKLVHQYYSCYPLLASMVVLWFNHYSMAPTKEAGQELLQEIIELCERIESGCQDIRVLNQEVGIKAISNLYLGKPDEVIEGIEELVETNISAQNLSTLLIQAFVMKGDLPQADYYNQVSAYSALMGLIGDGIVALGLPSTPPERCEMVIERMEKMVDIFKLEKQNFNVVLQLRIQETFYYCRIGEKDKAIQTLQNFVHGGIELVKGPLRLHGDDYFTKLDSYLEKQSLATTPPRQPKVILASMVDNLQHPLLAPLFDTEEYKQLLLTLKKEIDTYDRH